MLSTAPQSIVTQIYNLISKMHGLKWSVVKGSRGQLGNTSQDNQFKYLYMLYLFPLQVC